MINLICPECRRENEAERSYCHDCGTRLERSALAKGRAGGPAGGRGRIGSMLELEGAKMRGRFSKSIKVLLAALFVAAIVQMLRSPELPPTATIATLPVQINLDLESLATDSRLGSLRYSEDQVNAYLDHNLRTKQAALSKYCLRFERAVVDLEEGYCRVAVERSLWGLALVTTGSYAAEIRNSDVSAIRRAGYIGRMPVHPALMKFGDFLFADVRSALEEERKSLTKLGAMEFHRQMVLITPKQAAQT